MSHSAGVTIQSMRIHGNAAHKQAFLQSLDHQTWQGEDAEEIIFIKKIHVSGYWWELAEKIATQANESSSINNHPKDSNDVIVFKSRADLVAQIINNILKQEIPWYQKLWLKQESIAATPFALLVSKIVDLPEIFERLIKLNILSEVMASLSSEEIQRLTHEIKYFLKINALPVFVKNDFHSVNKSTGKSATIKSWFSVYFSAMNKIPLNSQASASITELIGLIGLWRWAPHKLNSTENRSLWYYEWISEFKHLPFIKQIALQQLPKKELIERADLIAPSPNGSQNSSFSSLSNTNQHVSQEFEESNNTLIDSTEWLTDFGGVFFLINELHQFKKHQHLFMQSDHSPWIVIYHFSQSLAKIMSVELDQSLRDIFCELTQLDLNQLESFHDNTDIQELVASAAQELEKKLRPLDLWNCDLLIARAKISLQSAHINIYFDQSWVRLAIRRAGLDVDPGWVSWLGRVIRFHYGNFPELTQTARRL